MWLLWAGIIVLCIIFIWFYGDKLLIPKILKKGKTNENKSKKTN